MMSHHTNTVGLWAACALPGDGPEFRFTAAPPRNPIRSWRSLLRSLWAGVR